MTRKVVSAGKFLADMTSKQIQCLHQFADCGPLIKWVREEIKGRKPFFRAHVMHLTLLLQNGKNSRPSLSWPAPDPVLKGTSKRSKWLILGLLVLDSLLFSST